MNSPMDNHKGAHRRPWRKIAEEASQEHDYDRLMELAAELSKALEHQHAVEALNQNQVVADECPRRSLFLLDY